MFSGLFMPPPDELPLNKPEYIVPYFGTPIDAIETILDLAELKSGEVFCDLGSGDGRVLIAAARRGAIAIGVEIKRELVEKSRRRIIEEGLKDRVYVTHGDLFKYNYISQADVIYIFLNSKANSILKPILEESLKDGARVVTLTYEIPGWIPVKKVKLPEKLKGGCGGRTLHLYRFTRKTIEQKTGKTSKTYSLNTLPEIVQSYIQLIEDLTGAKYSSSETLREYLEKSRETLKTEIYNLLAEALSLIENTLYSGGGTDLLRIRECLTKAINTSLSCS
ncbi:MAG: methyltransferase domain-containing protein [Candidatus Methanomethylicia archaeon]